MATHLVIGDPHCTPKASNERFLWAGKFARDLKKVLKEDDQERSCYLVITKKE